MDIKKIIIINYINVNIEIYININIEDKKTYKFIPLAISFARSLRNTEEIKNFIGKMNKYIKSIKNSK